jgi:hypothetical protein
MNIHTLRSAPSRDENRVLVTTLLFNGSTAPQLTSGVSSTASRVGSSRWNLAAPLIKSVPIEPVRGDGMGRCGLFAPNIGSRCVEGDGESIGVPTFVGVDDVGDNDDVDVESERLGRFLSSSNERPEVARCRDTDAVGFREGVATVGDVMGGESWTNSVGKSDHVRWMITFLVAH